MRLSRGGWPENGGVRGDDGDDEVMRWKRRWMWCRGGCGMVWRSAGGRRSRRSGGGRRRGSKGGRE
ncbi:hypothetical protein Tco_1180473, partial [Tanacetum coccineum]